jgi:hypothetical protein
MKTQQITITAKTAVIHIHSAPAIVEIVVSIWKKKQFVNVRRTNKWE